LANGGHSALLAAICRPDRLRKLKRVAQGTKSTTKTRFEPARELSSQRGIRAVGCACFWLEIGHGWLRSEHWRLIFDSMKHSLRSLARAAVALALLALLPAARAATVSDGGTATLTIDLAAGEALTVVSGGGSYTFSLNGLNVFLPASGTDPANQASNFDAPFVSTGTIVLNSTGQAAYTTINITDSGTGASVTFADSGANAYSDNFTTGRHGSRAGADVQRRFFLRRERADGERGQYHLRRIFSQRDGHDHRHDIADHDEEHFVCQRIKPDDGERRIDPLCECGGDGQR
jgi:hypothetical protein